MSTNNSISQDLYDLLTTKNFDPEIRNQQGAANPEDATIFKFDYVASSGKNYGTAVLVLDDKQQLTLFFGDNLGRSMDNDEDKDEWFAFVQQLGQFATRHGRYTFDATNISALKHTLAGMAAIKEGLFEGYYGSRRVSYTGPATEARLVINHNRLLDENDKRYRYVESLFIETADGERFKLPFTKLVGGRAMLEHVRQGGRPYDVRGVHIGQVVQEMNVLARFNRASQQRIFEGQTQQLVEAAQQYYKNLQGTLKQIGSPRGYNTYFESWTPATVAEHESLVEDLKSMFVEQTIDSRIEQALPTLAKIHRGTKMKEAAEFESWANRLVEGTWALPETPEAKDTLYTLLANPLPVGPDAANVTEQLYDILGDDELFDRLIDLANKDANADARPVIIARMKEMGMTVPGVKDQPEVTEGDNLATFEGSGCNMTNEGQYCPEHGLAECGYMESMGGTVAGAVAPGMHQQDMTEDQLDEINWKKAAATGALALGALGAMSPAQARVTMGPDGQMTPSFAQRMQQQFATQNASGGGAGGSGGQQSTGYSAEYLQKVIDGKVARPLISKEKAQQLLDAMKESVAEGAELAVILRHAGVPMAESVLTDSTGHTLDHILQRFSREVAEFKKGADLDRDLYDALYDYYFDDMPYGVKKARTGDPYEWVTDRLDQELGTGNSAPRLPIGGNAPTLEGSGCNMTAEGEYCPRHGLSECAMEEDAAPFGPAATAAIQQGKPPTEVHHADTGDKMNAAFQNTLMKERNDPMDARHAVTDSFYESEIDRLKKLALGR